MPTRAWSALVAQTHGRRGAAELEVPTSPKLPKDPWGNDYQFVNPGVKGEIDVFSLGADGQAGGEGKNADIGSWQ